jgi:hypothetical protein
MNDVMLAEMTTAELAHLRNRIDFELENRRALNAADNPDELEDDEIDELDEEEPCPAPPSS